VGPMRHARAVWIAGANEVRPIKLHGWPASKIRLRRRRVEHVFQLRGVLGGTVRSRAAKAKLITPHVLPRLELQLGDLIRRAAEYDVADHLHLDRAEYGIGRRIA